MTEAELNAHIAEVEQIDAERDRLLEQRRQVYERVKAAGGKVKTLRTIVRLRKEQRALDDQRRAAIGPDLESCLDRAYHDALK